MTAAGAGLYLAMAAVLLSALGPIGTRSGWWPFTVGFSLLGGGVLLAIAALVFGLAAAFRTGGWAAAPGLIVAMAVIAVPAAAIVSARGAPAIHEITTDVDDPPAFEAILPLRSGAPNPPEYGGQAVAAAQRRAFPDIEPLVLPVPPPEAFRLASAAARDLGWQIVSADEEALRIEAVDTTFWFGFNDDVAVRVRAVPGGSRVDVRSKSRVGAGDLGANARRVRALLRALSSGP